MQENIKTHKKNLLNIQEISRQFKTALYFKYSNNTVSSQSMACQMLNFLAFFFLCSGIGVLTYQEKKNNLANTAVIEKLTIHQTVNKVTFCSLYFMTNVRLFDKVTLQFLFKHVRQ